MEGETGPLQGTPAPRGEPSRRPPRLESRWGLGLRKLIRKSPEYRGRSDLVDALNDVAAAVSSADEINQVLGVIVDRAKRITDTDKVALVLTDEHSERLDFQTVVVRGRRDQHPQEWWENRLLSVEDSLMESSELLVERHVENDAWLLSCPVRVEGQAIGVMCAISPLSRPFNSTQVEFFAILAAFAAGAIRSARLADESRSVLLASERERIAREMHDGVVQSLFSVSLGLGLCRKQVLRDPERVASRLEELQDHVNTAMGELRRLIYALRPARLAELGLAGAIEFWISEVSDGEKTVGRLVLEGEQPVLRPSQEACLYRVAKEAVSNVVRHAHASQFEVRLSSRGGEVALTVADNGVGFDPTSAEQAEVGTVGMGLRSMHQQVEREGGVFSIESKPGGGTVVTARLRPGAAR